MLQQRRLQHALQRQQQQIFGALVRRQQRRRRGASAGGGRAAGEQRGVAAALAAPGLRACGERAEACEEGARRTASSQVQPRRIERERTASTASSAPCRPTWCTPAAVICSAPPRRASSASSVGASRRCEERARRRCGGACAQLPRLRQRGRRTLRRAPLRRAPSPRAACPPRPRACTARPRPRARATTQAPMHTRERGRPCGNSTHRRQRACAALESCSAQVAVTRRAQRVQRRQLQRSSLRAAGARQRRRRLQRRLRRVQRLASLPRAAAPRAPRQSRSSVCGARGAAGRAEGAQRAPDERPQASERRAAACEQAAQKSYALRVRRQRRLPSGRAGRAVAGLGALAPRARGHGGGGLLEGCGGRRMCASARAASE
jgi:hypothetical protein